MRVPAVVVPYDPRWSDVFDALRDRADAALAGIAHVTEHVGSTAVPGLDAKPIVDLDVVVPDPAGVGPAVAALAAAGWAHEGDPAIAGREAFRPPADTVYHHLYVVVAGRPAHRDHVELRDFLRAHPDEAARYGELKRRLAGLLETDRAAYADGKAEMISELLRQARADPPAPATCPESPMSPKSPATERIGSFFPAQHEPPPNELPAVLAPALTWPGDEIIMAIPSLLVYTTGVDLLLIYRTRAEQPRDTENARATAAALRGLTANGRPVELQHGRHDEHGFTYRAWVPFEHSQRADPSGDITFELDWPGIEPARHRVTGIREAAAQAVVLW
ncbi:MAG TPA: GrpB family protein [Streptosporangiaceae bacterium]|nr:GrpB family protein [Streptosporangiaceae bacterium]